MLAITVQQDNDAFYNGDDHEPGLETARILRIIADRIEQGEENGSEQDVNGNMVAMFTSNIARIKSDAFVMER